MTATRTATPVSLFTAESTAAIMTWYAGQTRPLVRDCAVVLEWAIDHGNPDEARAAIADTQVALGLHRSPADDDFLTVIYRALVGR